MEMRAITSRAQMDFLFGATSSDMISWAFVRIATGHMTPAGKTCVRKDNLIFTNVFMVGCKPHLSKQWPSPMAHRILNKVYC